MQHMDIPKKSPVIIRCSHGIILLHVAESILLYLNTEIPHYNKTPHSRPNYISWTNYTSMEDKV